MIFIRRNDLVQNVDQKNEKYKRMEMKGEYEMSNVEMVRTKIDRF